MKKTKISLGALLAVGLSLAITSCNKDADSAEDPGPVQEGEVLAQGTFEGRSDHEVSGGVEIVKSGEVFVVNLGVDFSLDNAPDPVVGLGKDGYLAKTEAGALKAKTGASSYELPKGIDPSEYDEVYIWCKKFDVPLGMAKLATK